MTLRSWRRYLLLAEIMLTSQKWRYWLFCGSIDISFISFIPLNVCLYNIHCTLWRRNIFPRKGNFCLKALRQKNTPIVWLIVAKYTTVICTQKKSQPKNPLLPEPQHSSFWVGKLSIFYHFSSLRIDFCFAKILISGLVRQELWSFCQ